jgi:hypothetical protein
MKSNVIMLSPDRELFGIKIRQQSQTGHMSLTDLQNAYEVARAQYGWSEKRFDHLLGQQENAERLYYLLEGQGLINVRFDTFMESVKTEGIIPLLKQAGAYVTKGRAANKATWCNPYVLVLVAMELNPMLYAKTVAWLTDSLLINRIEAGTMYRGLATALGRMGYQKPDDFATVARALNFVVFGRHEAGLRQVATADQLKELAGLEEKTAWAIEMGMIKNGNQLLDSLRNAWRLKFNRAIGRAAA